ncbi:unnamed protein product [Mytilus coruscus]|uniref:SAM domain-containing protein n=1 Tax=Mytilus coruscus TaxID=42192 RepID=A0A6J8EY16_MYTCO|nr:unnamed protein product [Mytilus coruscus]
MQRRNSRAVECDLRTNIVPTSLYWNIEEVAQWIEELGFPQYSINDEIKEGMKQRDYYHKKKDTYNYKFWRNKVKYLIENSKQKFKTDVIEHEKGNSCKLWKHLHNVNGSENYHDHAIFNDCNNKPITDPKSVADTFNNYFTNITENINLTSNSSTSCSGKLDNYISCRMPENVFFTIPQITNEFVLHQLITLDESKATGLDNISTKFF